MMVLNVANRNKVVGLLIFLFQNANIGCQSKQKASLLSAGYENIPIYCKKWNKWPTQPKFARLEIHTKINIALHTNIGILSQSIPVGLPKRGTQTVSSFLRGSGFSGCKRCQVFPNIWPNSDHSPFQSSATHHHPIAGTPTILIEKIFSPIEKSPRMLLGICPGCFDFMKSWSWWRWIHKSPSRIHISPSLLLNVGKTIP